jgi:hypothetical protein
VVTEQKAAELSRPPDPSKAKPAPPPKPPAKGAKNAPAPALATVQAAQTAAQVPTAGSETSGIGGSGTLGDKTMSVRQGETRVVTTPEGKKTVRIVAPTLGPTLQGSN